MRHASTKNLKSLPSYSLATRNEFSASESALLWSAPRLNFKSSNLKELVSQISLSYSICDALNAVHELRTGLVAKFSN